MTFAYWCVALAGFMPLVWIGYAKFGAGGYDNANPRPWRARLAGRYQRAAAAETNSLEAFPLFAAGVIIAELAGARQPVIDTLAGVFIAARIVHGTMYIMNRDLCRSLAWMTGFLCTIGLFLAASATG